MCDGVGGRGVGLLRHHGGLRLPVGGHGDHGAAGAVDLWPLRRSADQNRKSLVDLPAAEGQAVALADAERGEHILLVLDRVDERFAARRDAVPEIVELRRHVHLYGHHGRGRGLREGFLLARRPGRTRGRARRRGFASRRGKGNGHGGGDDDDRLRGRGQHRHTLVRVRHGIRAEPDAQDAVAPRRRMGCLVLIDQHRLAARLGQHDPVLLGVGGRQYLGYQT
mmetsp:Transcript_6345/g.16546  ORF Transcript_6345/g.16546 Transcript_6345/m.16546 type:complete len:223 (+) Transcript_6345:571-1239(+)